MPLVLPLTSDGERFFTCSLGEKTYNFRTYYVTGFKNFWLMDIFDENNRPLEVGIKIVPGSTNVVKGQGSVFYGEQALVSLVSGDVNGEESLGEGVPGLWVTWFLPGEQNFVVNGDPWDTLGDAVNILDGIQF